MSLFLRRAGVVPDRLDHRGVGEGGRVARGRVGHEGGHHRDRGLLGRRGVGLHAGRLRCSAGWPHHTQASRPLPPGTTAAGPDVTQAQV